MNIRVRIAGGDWVPHVALQVNGVWALGRQWFADPDDEQDDDAWAVTHLPTGYALVKTAERRARWAFERAVELVPWFGERLVVEGHSIPLLQNEPFVEVVGAVCMAARGFAEPHVSWVRPWWARSPMPGRTYDEVRVWRDQHYLEHAMPAMKRAVYECLADHGRLPSALEEERARRVVEQSEWDA